MFGLYLIFISILFTQIFFMQRPLISVLLCTYNGAAFLEEQIESILSQTYPVIEIIISDDASTDGTINIIKKYSTNSIIIININQENIGLQKNIEVAAGLSKGNYIAFSDQDDIWLPDKLEKLHAAIGNHSLVYSDSKLVDEYGNDLHKSLSDFRNLQNIYSSKGWGIYNAVSGHTMLAAKELLQYVLPIPAGYYHDWWIAVQASNLNGIKFLNEKLTLYRQHGKNLTENIIQKELGSRTYSKRYQQYVKDLKWIELLKNNPIEKEKSFYTDFYMLYLLKSKGHFVWPLFWFLTRNQNTIFLFSKKNYLSQLFEIRKRARGEKEI